MFKKSTKVRRCEVKSTDISLSILITTSADKRPNWKTAITAHLWMKSLFNDNNYSGASAREAHERCTIGKENC